MCRAFIVFWAIALLTSCGIFRNEKSVRNLDVLKSERRLDLRKIDTTVRLRLEYRPPVVIPSRTLDVLADWNGTSASDVNELFTLVLELDSTGKKLRGALTLPETPLDRGGVKLEYEKKGQSESDQSKNKVNHKTEEKHVDRTVSWRTVVLGLGLVVLVLIFIYIRWPKR